MSSFKQSLLIFVFSRNPSRQLTVIYFYHGIKHDLVKSWNALHQTVDPVIFRPWIMHNNKQTTQAWNSVIINGEGFSQTSHYHPLAARQATLRPIKTTAWAAPVPYKHVAFLSEPGRVKRASSAVHRTSRLFLLRAKAALWSKTRLSQQQVRLILRAARSSRVGPRVEAR